VISGTPASGERGAPGISSGHPPADPILLAFDRAPSPDADPYVSPNERITEGQVVCIVEAMKLMNEIESEVSGRVVRIMVENAKPVEFGQVLFLIDPKS
jgi:acetyl-CoA carboxylase biotin carboxyl carrier protein